MERIETGIYQRPDGRLVVNTTARDPRTGKIRHMRQTLDEGRALEDARAVRAELKASVQRTRTTHHAPILVGQYAVYWLEQKLETVKPSTQRGYARATQVLVEQMGALMLSDVVRDDLVRLRQHLEAMRHDGRPYSTHTLRGWWRVIRIMFADAVADRHLDADPCARVDPPTTPVVAVQERDTLTADELHRLVTAARVHVPDRYAEIVTLAYTGMRAGELYGLEWDAVDFERGAITIRQAVSGGILVRSTKTGAPRVTAMHDVVADALREHRSDARSGLVFPSDAGTPRQHGTLRRALERAARFATQPPCRGIEIAVSPQVLRRTFNTLLVAAGVDRIVQQQMMGHTSDQMTARYTGATLEQKRAVVLRLVGE